MKHILPIIFILIAQVACKASLSTSERSGKKTPETDVSGSENQPNTETPPASNVNDLFSSSTLNLSKSSGTIASKITITFTVTDLDPSISLSDYDVQFSALSGTISTPVISGNTVTATYENSSIGTYVISVYIDGKKLDGFEVSYEAKSILAAWRDSLPAVFSAPQSENQTSSSYHQVAMDNAGNAVIAWMQSDGTKNQIFKSEYRSGSWTHPSSLADNISPDGQSASIPQVAMDNSGNTIITWKQSDGTKDQTFKSEYRSGSWTHPSGLADNISPDGQAVLNPQVAMDDLGNSIITWSQSDGSNSQIFISEYRSGSWTHPSSLTDNISIDGQSATIPQVAMDDQGNAVVTWQQSDGSNNQVFKSEYRNGSWTHPSSLTNDHISPDGQHSSSPQVAMDNLGNSIITWHQGDGSNSQIYKSEYRSGNWTHPSNLLTDNISIAGQNAFFSQVAMDNAGNAIITWHQSDGTTNQIYKSEYRSGSWTHPSNLLTDNISQGGQMAYYPQVAMDDLGNSVITWHQNDGAVTQIFKSEYRSGSWTHPSSLTDNISPDGSSATDPQVAMDNLGNSVIVWKQSYGTKNQIFISDHRSGGWTHPSSITDNISPEGISYSLFPQVAMDDQGNAVVGWSQSDGSNNQVFKSEYRSGSWTHPSSLTDSISPNGQSVSAPQVAMDNLGNSVITWYQNDGAVNQIFKSEYRSGNWTHPSSLTDNISIDGQNASIPKVAMDNLGNTIITWYQNDGVNNQIFKSEYRNGIWTHPSSLTNDHISPDGQHSSAPQVAMDNLGNSVITWIQSDGSNNQVFKSEYRNGSWTHPSSLTDDHISPDGQPASAPQVAMDNLGNSVITWTQSDGAAYQVFKSEYRSGSWTHPSSLTDNISPDGQHTNLPQVAMDDSGNAIITWKQSDGTRDQIFKSEYRSGSWTHPSSLADNISPDNYSFKSFVVAMNNSGEATILALSAENFVFGLVYYDNSWHTDSFELVPNFKYNYSSLALTANNDSFMAVGTYPSLTNTQTGIRVLEFVK